MDGKNHYSRVWRGKLLLTQEGNGVTQKICRKNGADEKKFKKNFNWGKCSSLYRESVFSMKVCPGMSFWNRIIFLGMDKFYKMDGNNQYHRK